MNEQTPETEKAPQKLHWGRLLIAILIVVGFFVVRGIFARPSRVSYIDSLSADDKQSMTLDHDLVMRTPNLFSGEPAYLEGTLEQIVPTAPEVTSRDIYLLVAEKDDPDHLWFVFGPFEAENVARLQTGMDIVAYGVCEGAITLTNKAGFDHTYPQIAFIDLQYGYQIGPDRP